MSNEEELIDELFTEIEDKIETLKEKMSENVRSKKSRRSDKVAQFNFLAGQTAAYKEVLKSLENV